MCVCVCVCSGMGGLYVLDENGDRDVNFSVIYTTTNNEVSFDPQL